MRDVADAGPGLPRLPAEPFGAGGRIEQFLLGIAGMECSLVSCSRFIVQPGHVTPVDVHAVHEVWMVAAGIGALTLQGRPHALETYQAYYFPSHTTHLVRNTGAVDLVVFSFWWAQE